MKILHVITSLHTGGAEKLISEIAPMQRSSNVEVDVLAFDGVETDFKNSLLKAGVKVFHFGMNCNVYNPIFIFRLAKMMCKYDIVHTHNTAPQLFAAMDSYFTSSKLVTTEHSTSNRRRDNAKYKWIDRWMYSRYKAVICISDMTKQNLLNYLGHTKTYVCTIENGINLKRFLTALPLPEMEKNTNKFVVTMVAGFRYQKDHETVIRAFSLLDKSKFELWFVGDGERRSIIEDYILKYNLKDNVRLWGIRTDIPSILKSSSVVLQSSHIEGFGLAAVEGMAVKKPVIATDIPGLGQVVKGAGILFPHEDEGTLASIIQQLYDDSDFYNQIAEKCWHRSQMFDIQKMVQGYQQIYQRLLDNCY